ncbi:MAG: response regulator transcription factor [Streptosporangiaceae bacterium]|jgi:two-component system OmpR family response regulator
MSSAPAQRGARLLVVDDEPVILELLAGALRFAGFDVLTAATGAEALRAAAVGQPDLILLDVMMPGCDGFEVIRRIHDSGPRIPVIFLTARDTPRDRVAGLSLGGDDYITKPFSLDEVLARISAVLRRSTGEAEPASRLAIADLELDQDSHQVRRAGTEVTLAPREFKLLRYLMTNAGRVLSREQILDHVWDYNFTGDSNIIESYISTLRRKVDTAEPHLIHTIRSIGYVLRIPPP